MKTFSCEGGEFDRERIFDRGEAEGRKWSSKSNSTHEHGKVSWARILYTTFYHDRHFIERLRRHMTCIEVQRNGKSSSQQHYITCHSYLIDIQDCSSTAAEEAGLYPIWTNIHSLLVTWIPPSFLVNIQYQSQQYIVDELFEMDISLTNHFSCMKLFKD